MSDREKASIEAANININEYKSGKSLWEIFQLGFIKGGHHADLEWQAKVQGLVEALEKISQRYNQWKDAGHYCESKKALQSVTDISRKALTQFTSGQPAKGVMVPTWTEEEILLAMQRALGVGNTKGWLTGDLIRNHLLAIKGIGKDGE